MVELLVVIGVIALLISILLPSLAKARQAANTVVCASNMRQVGLAMQMYVNDHQGTLPMGVLILPGWTWALGWEDQIAGYMGKTFATDAELGWLWNTDAPALRCPEDNQIPPISWLGGFRKTYAMNTCEKYIPGSTTQADFYGMTGACIVNVNPWTWTPPFIGQLQPRWPGYDPAPPRFYKLTEARDAASTILMAECAYEGNVIGWGQWSRTGTIDGPELQTNGLLMPLHSNKFNYLMCDGHVEAINPNATYGTGTLQVPNGMWTRATDD